MVLHQGHDTEVCFVKLSTARASKKDQREKVYLLTQLFFLFPLSLFQPRPSSGHFSCPGTDAEKGTEDVQSPESGRTGLRPESGLVLIPGLCHVLGGQCMDGNG